MNSDRLPKIGPFKTPHDGNRIVYWEDPRSGLRLSRADNKAFWRLTRFFEPQNDKFTCGPASLAMVMNALRIGDGITSLPLDKENESFPRRLGIDLPESYVASFPKYTQRNIFDVKGSPKTAPQIYGMNGAGYGITLNEAQQLLVCHGFQSNLYVVEKEFEVEEHHTNISHALSSEGFYVIGNFDRAVWGLEGQGHICPIGAVDGVSRSVLLLDVNPLGRWLWIDLQLLLQSMVSKDGLSPRGYIIVRSAQ